MSKKSNLIHQAKKSLTKQCHYGESKHEAKQKAKEARKAKKRGIIKDTEDKIVSDENNEDIDLF